MSRSQDRGFFVFTGKLLFPDKVNQKECLTIQGQIFLYVQQLRKLQFGWGEIPVILDFLPGLEYNENRRKNKIGGAGYDAL